MNLSWTTLNAVSEHLAAFGWQVLWQSSLDVWTSCVQSMLQVVYWWHPLLWFANARMRAVREEAVDDAVMSALSEDSPTYAPTLLEVARLALRRPVTALGFVGILESRSALKARIRRLLDMAAPRKSGINVAGLLCIAAFGAVALPMGPAPQAESQQPPVENRATSADPSAVLIQDAKLLYEMGKLEEAKTKLQNVIRQFPTNQAAYFYLNLIREAEYQRQAKAVIAVPRPQGPNAGASPNQFYTRVFKVDPNTFKESLLGLSGDSRNRMAEDLPGRVHAFFESIGVDLRSPTTFYYKETEGSLLIRATLSDLDKIEQAIAQLNEPAAQINVRIRTAQLPRAQAATFWAGMSPQNPTNKTVILDRDEARQQLARLMALAGPDEISQPSIITAHGRQARIQIGEMISVITTSNTPSGSSQPVAFQTNQVPVGLRVDLLPSVGADFYTIKMNISASFTELLGYDEPPPWVTASLPLPHFRVRQIDFRTVSVPDGLTVVLGGSGELDGLSQPVPLLGELPLLRRLFRSEWEKELILFITPTMVDPAGNPVHEQGR